MIRFKRYPRKVGESIAWSQRRETLAKSKPKRQAKKLSKKAPLFSELLEEEAKSVKVDVEEIKANRQLNLDRTIKNKRDSIARVWREARKRFFSCDKATQEIILAKYNNRWMPKEAQYFYSLVDKYSGDQAKRIARYDKEFEDWKADRAKNVHTQPALI